MNRVAGLLVIFGVLFLVGAVGQTVMAQAEPPMTDDQINVIRQNCVKAQTSLNELHASDALMRVNRGELYELISSKLMAPLNSRIALNRMGGLKLAATTLDYDRQYDSFYNDYVQYEEAMSHTLDINCVNEPVTFHDSLKDARDKRQKVHADTLALNALLEAYRANFEDFAANALKDTSQ